MAAKNTAHVVDKMLHACGGTGYKRDMELERYLRDAKAGWVMGPTNEVLRQFVGKAVLLGFDSLDYWNQTYNRRAVENEVKKLDADGKRKLAEELLARSRRRRRPRGLAPMATRTGRVLLAAGCSRRDPSRETYRVRPGGATEVRLAGDDRIRIIDRHGGQVAVLSRRPRGASGCTGRPALGTRSTLFGPDSEPGRARVELTADRDATLLVAAPGGRIVDGDAPATELLLEIRRATPRAARARSSCPAPLAEPRLDFRIDAATALSYEVRAGEYIQIIDVQGRQCSDFLAFHRAQARGRASSAGSTRR